MPRSAGTIEERGWDLASKRPVYLAQVPSAGTGLALTPDTLWVASTEGDVVYRFRLPKAASGASCFVRRRT